MGIFKTFYWTLCAYYDVLEVNIRKNIFKQKFLADDEIKAKWTNCRMRKKYNYDESKILSKEQISNELKDL